MPTVPGTIDLGELAPEPPTAIDVIPPIRERLRRLGAGRVRPALAVVLVALVGVGVAGSAVGPEPPLVPRFTLPATSFAIDRDNLYVVDTSTPEGTVAAYRLDDGARLWRHSSTGPGLWLAHWHGLLLAMTVSESDIQRTSQLDPDTGRPLWIHEGWPAAFVGDRLLLQHPVPNERSSEALGPADRVTAVDVETGDVAWTRELASWSAQVVPGRPARLVALTDQGDLTSYDVSTGQPVRSVSTTASPEYARLSVVGPVVLLDDESGSAVTGYDVQTLARRWTVRDPNLGIAPCGRLLCLNGSEPPRALDPATGRTVWTADWAPAGDGPGAWFVEPEEPLDGHLVLSRISGYNDVASWLAAADTGRPVLDLRPWQLSWPSQVDPPGQMVLTRYEHGATWIGRLRPDLSGVEVLGTADMGRRLEPFEWGCELIAEQLVCFAPAENARGRVSVWRVR